MFASTFSLQKVNCPELIRLLMSYNFLAEATAVSLDYMNAFMGHGLEYFDIKVRDKRVWSFIIIIILSL